MAKINFGGVDENVVTREEFTLEKAREVLKDEVIAVIEIDVSDGGNQHTSRLGAFDGLGTVVGQSVRSVIGNKYPVRIA